MCDEGGPGGEDPETIVAFDEELSSLKRHGSNLLVVQSDGPGAHGDACQRLLGDAVAEPRRRLFVYTDIGPDAVRKRLSGARPGNDAKFVDWVTTTRSTAVETYPAAVEPSAVHTVDGGLSELGVTVSETIDAFADDSDGLDAAELRVCLDSLTPLLAEYSAEHVFEFLHVLTERIKSVRAMGHVHLPVPYTDPEVRRLEPLFDAVIETRTTDDAPMQRWHVEDRDITTEWIPL